LLRLSKNILGMVRITHFFKELQLIVNCIFGSFLSLFWSIIVILGFTLIFSTVIVQQLSTYLSDQDSHVTVGVVEKIRTHFGSIALSTRSLFMSISGGRDWGDFNELVAPSGLLASSLFLFYIVLMWLAIANIITSIFVERAMKLAQPDLDAQILQKHKDDLSDARLLRGLFHRIVDDSQVLTLEGFKDCMNDMHVASFLDLKGLDVNDVSIFFTLLKLMAGKEDLDAEAFTTGCLRMRGVAKSIDLLTLSYQVQLFEKRLTQSLTRCSKEIQNLRKDLVLRLSSNNCLAKQVLSEFDAVEAEFPTPLHHPLARQAPSPQLPSPISRV